MTFEFFLDQNGCTEVLSATIGSQCTRSSPLHPNQVLEVPVEVSLYYVMEHDGSVSLESIHGSSCHEASNL